MGQKYTNYGLMMLFWCSDSSICCRWLAPLLLLLDLYEKFASVSKIKAILEAHVVWSLHIFVICRKTFSSCYFVNGNLFCNWSCIPYFATRYADISYNKYAGCWHPAVTSNMCLLYCLLDRVNVLSGKKRDVSYG